MADVSKPVIIVGTGRCGSTVFHQLLSKHPEMMWLSGLCDRYPTRPEINRHAVTAVSHPIIARLARGKIQPDECYKFWEQHAHGFAEPCRDLVATDVTPTVKHQVRAVMGEMLTPARYRLLVKITGWPRVSYLNEIFGDAKFIHLIRDGREVASSLLHVNFWRGWQGPQGWRAGLLSAEDQAIWERYDRSFVALAGLEWRIQMRAMELARSSVDPARFLEIKYEDFCAQPEKCLQRVLEFAELPMSAELTRQLVERPIRKASHKWRDRLTDPQQRILHEILDEDVKLYGYREPLDAVSLSRNTH